MFRAAISATRAVSKNAFAASSRKAVMQNANRSVLLATNNQQTLFQNKQVRFYSGAPELTKEIISERIIELLESYSKTAEGVEITDKTSFSKDLGYDSFDIVEIVMEIEYEFSILIPDKEADEIKTVGQAVDFISRQADAC